MERQFTLIGHPLGHTLSPVIHEKLFSLSGKAGTYTVTDIPENQLENNIRKLSQLAGYNITIPYKTEIIPFLSELDSSAERYGAVNCVVNTENGAKGYNTDCIGFLRSLEAKGISLSGKVLLLGCGGAGRMMATEAALHGAELTIAVRNPEKAEEVLDGIRKLIPGYEAEIVGLDGVEGRFDLCVNSTPVGMFPNNDNSPVDEKTASCCEAVFDAIYNPTPTKLMNMFLREGKKAVGGMSMLVWQAVAAHEIWDNSRYDEKDIAELIADMEVLLK